MDGESSLNKTKWVRTDQKIEHPDITTEKSEGELRNTPNTKSTREHIEKYGHAPELTPAIINLIDKKINYLKEANGIPTTNDDEPKIYFLNPENYEKAVGLFQKNEDAEKDKSQATYLVEADKIIVRDDGSDPHYLVASSIFHERVHREIDLKVRVYRQGDEEIHSNLKRGGLSVLRRTNTGIDEEYGALINELGNFGVQKEVIQELLAMPEYAEEATVRKERLKKLGINNQTALVSVPFSELGTVHFDTHNVHFDSAGDLRIGFGPYIMMQLVDDLKIACPEISNVPFEEALVRAKAHPEFQNQIRNSLDNTLGDGFYSRLKRAPYDANVALQILYDVQKSTRKLHN